MCMKKQVEIAERISHSLTSELNQQMRNNLYINTNIHKYTNTKSISAVVKSKYALINEALAKKIQALWVSDGGFWRDKKYIAKALTRVNQQNTKWCWGGSAIHVMSKLNRSHSASDCRWSVALMILLQMVILWYCLENHRWKKIGWIYETVYFQKSLDLFFVWFVLVASQKFSSHILLSFQWQDPPRWITFPLCQFSFLLSTVPMDNSLLLPVFHITFTFNSHFHFPAKANAHMYRIRRLCRRRFSSWFGLCQSWRCCAQPAIKKVFKKSDSVQKRFKSKSYQSWLICKAFQKRCKICDLFLEAFKSYHCFDSFHFFARTVSKFAILCSTWNQRVWSAFKVVIDFKCYSIQLRRICRSIVRLFIVDCPLPNVQCLLSNVNWPLSNVKFTTMV